MTKQTQQNTEGINFAKQIFRKGSYLSKLIEKERLKWYEKILFEDCTQRILERLKRKDLSSFLEIKNTLSKNYPNTQPWQIYVETYNSIYGNDNRIKRNPPLLIRQ